MKTAWILVAASLASMGASPPEKPVATATSAQQLTEEDRRAIAAEQKRLADLAKEYEEVTGGDSAGRVDRTKDSLEGPPEKSLFAAFFQMVLVLGAVCLLAYLLLGKLLPKLMKIEPPLAQHRIMQVIDRMPLDQRRSIMVIRIGEAYYLVGASEQGISLLSRLDGDDVLRALASAESKAPQLQLGKLAGLLMKKSETRKGDER